MAKAPKSDLPDPQSAALLASLGSADRGKAAGLWLSLAGAMPETIAALISSLEDPDREIRSGAIRALGALARQAREILNPVRSALKRVSLWDEDDSIRSLSAEMLAQAGEGARTPITETIQALNDANASIRFSAAQALGERAGESQAAVGLLLQKALRDPDGGVRLEAAMALYKIDGQVEKILPMLLKALQDPDEVRRWIAADCLGEIGPPAREAIPLLREMLQREFKSPLIRAGVDLALKKIEAKQP